MVCICFLKKYNKDLVAAAMGIVDIEEHGDGKMALRHIRKKERINFGQIVKSEVFMQKMFLTAAVMLMFVGIGCVRNPVPPVDARVTIAPGLGSGILVTSVRCMRNEAGYCLFQANVVNNYTRVARLEYKVQWLDETGMEIESAVSSWQSMAVQPREIKGLSAVAASKDAVDFRFYLRPYRR